MGCTRVSGTTRLINTACQTEPVEAGRSAAILLSMEQVAGPSEDNVYYLHGKTMLYLKKNVDAALSFTVAVMLQCINHKLINTGTHKLLQVTVLDTKTIP